MTEFVVSMRPGLTLTLLALALAVLLGVALWFDNVRAKRRAQRKASERQRLRERAQAGLPMEKTSDMEFIWSDAMRSMESLQDQLKENLRSLENKLKDERQEVEMKVETLKSLARTNRLPLTLYELYEGLRHFNRKNEEAQAADMVWHSKIGITQVDVVDAIGDPPGYEIFFIMDDESYLLVGRHHRYSRTSFIELSLVDRDNSKLATVRVRPDADGRSLLADAVITIRSGPWIQAMLSCRAKMDVRAQEVNLMAAHADVERLKENFQIQATSPRL